MWCVCGGGGVSWGGGGECVSESGCELVCACMHV